MVCRAGKHSIFSCRRVCCLYNSCPHDPCILSHVVILRPAPRAAGWKHTRPGHSSCSLLPDRCEHTHSHEPGHQTEQDLPCLLPNSRLQPVRPCTGDGDHPLHHRIWFKRIGFVVNLIVLKNVNHASGHLEVQCAGYESQNSFRPQGMRFD